MNLTPSRYASRSTSTDQKALFEFLDESLVGTFSYSVNSIVKSISTGFHRHEENIYIHGSLKSNFLKELLEAKERACICIHELNALVLAETAINHSVNYRSAVIFSKPELVVDKIEKEKQLINFMEKFAPGRMEVLPKITDQELHATSVLRFKIDQFSLKARSGGTSVNKDVSMWTGVLERTQYYSNAIPDSGSESKKTPDHVQELLK